MTHRVIAARPTATASPALHPAYFALVMATGIVSHRVRSCSGCAPIGASRCSR